jgi:hypothetical protein
MSLTDREVTWVLGMAARGDNKHDIAAFFGVNQARIAEAEDGKYGSFKAAPAHELPPSGPIGPKAQRMRKALEFAMKAIETGDIEDAKARVAMAISIYEKNT